MYRSDRTGFIQDFYRIYPVKTRKYRSKSVLHPFFAFSIFTTYSEQKSPDFLLLLEIRAFFFGDPSENRTPDTLLKRQVLCRLS